MAGNRIVRQRISIIAMIVMMIYVLEQTPNMFAQRVVQNQRGVVFCQPHTFRLFQHIGDPTIIDFILQPAVG